jgi:general secretion pathway protein F
MPLSGTNTPFLVVAARAGGGRALSVRRARSRPALAESLRREKLLLVSAYRLPAWAGAASSEPKLRLADHAVLDDQLAQLLSRGVPLVEALEVAASTVRPAARSPIERLRELVAAGSSFADACATVGGFDAVTIAVYRAAERTGDLSGASRQLATSARRTLAVSGRAVTLLIYPAIVLGVSILIMAGMLIFIVPRLGEGLAEAGVELPAFTRVMISLGNFMSENLLLVLGVTVAMIIAALLGRGLLARAAMVAARTLPLLRNVLLAQETARFFSVMAAMSRSGVPIADALGTANQAINHPALRQQMERLRTRLVEGGVLRLLIDEVAALPLSTRRLLIAAERAGDMESAFASLATDMIDEVERASARALAVLQPLLIIFMFIGIGSLLMSFLIPLLSLSSSVGR